MTCGYCGGSLIAYLEPRSETGTAYRCEPCQPELAAIKTTTDWIAFHKERAKFKRKVRKW